MRQRAPSIEAGSKPPDPENYRFGKRLEDEIYVASEASATPVASYAPLSNFSGPSAFHCLGLREPRCYPALDFPLPTTLVPRPFATRADRHQAAHFRRIFIMTRVDHSRMANAIRALAMDAVEKANSGHPGLPMGAADVATVLFTQFLKFDAADPHWPDRDRFILSAGHGSMLLYALLYLTGNAGRDARADREFPPARLQDPRPPREFHHLRRRDHHRPARPGRRVLGRLGAGRAAAGGGIRRGYRRSLHLRAVLRRRPDGRRQP